MKICRHTIRLHLLALVFAIGLPLGCVVAEGLKAEIERDRHAACREITILAELVASHLQVGRVRISLPPGSLWIAVNSQGEIRASSFPLTPGMASDIEGKSLLTFARERHHSCIHSQAFDGVDRLFGLASRVDNQNRVLVGIPTHTAFAAMRAHAWRHSILLALILGMACFFALLLSRRLEEPICALEAASLRVMQMDLSQDVSVSGPVELQKVAQQFNAMQHGLQRAEVERRNYETDLLRSREELRSLAARLESTIETERTRIAREIHDDLGQLLIILRLNIFELKHFFEMNNNALDAGQALETRLTSMTQLIDQTLTTVRRIATELRPAVLDLGLESAADWLLHEFETQTGIDCALRYSFVDEPLPNSHSTALFRILQESLTNVARHAHASHISVEIRGEIRGAGDTSPCVVLCVHDNGRGFREADVSHRGSLGLIGMRERATLLGGAFEIQSIPGEGTSICVALPLPCPARPAA